VHPPADTDRLADGLLRHRRVDRSRRRRRVWQRALARAPLTDTVNRTKITAAPDHIAACPLSPAQLPRAFLGCLQREGVYGIVLDTCVIVTAFRSRNGASRVLLDWVADRLLVPLLTPALFLQYKDVLKRPEQLRVSRADTAQAAARFGLRLARPIEVLDEMGQ
jgi:PIN domain